MKSSISLFTAVSLLLLILLLGSSDNSFASSAPEYKLAISFDLESSTLVGTAAIEIPAGEEYTIYSHDLTPTAIVLNTAAGRSMLVEPPSSGQLIVPRSNEDRILYISYTKNGSTNPYNRIEIDGITLLQNWYPQPDRAMQYRLSAALPEGFSAISESDTFPLYESGSSVIAEFSSPLQAIHFVAGPYLHRMLEVRPGLKVHSLFFPEEEHLADGYLKAAAGYMKSFEERIGPFPYNHYVITANRLPTGLGLPTFTLLGQSVLRLPFIKETSLGHEVLHAWFGNSVDIAPGGGNWSEGLTSYLADHLFRDRAGEGADYRKETIINYLSYAGGDAPIALNEFRTGSHHQPLAKAKRAVGYGKSLMLFSELELLLGEESFTRGLREIYTEYRNSAASWDDLRTVFERVSGRDLARFFMERLSRKDIPGVSAHNFRISAEDNQFTLRFRLSQETDHPYSLQLVIHVATLSGEYRFLHQSDESVSEVVLSLPSRPLSVTLDPDYNMMRSLTMAEDVPSLSRFLGSTHKLVIAESAAAKELYGPFISLVGLSPADVKLDTEVTNADLTGHDLMFLGTDLQSYSSIFGPPKPSPPGVTMEMSFNPLDRKHAVLVARTSGAEELQLVAHRLRHYGKYTRLHFLQGRLQSKSIMAAEKGTQYILADPPQGGSTRSLHDFQTLAREMAQNDVIYIGENHTSASDHLLQLQVIEAVYRHHPDLALGMEMFPASSQEALDEYFTSESVDEREFLRASRYFDVWRYDFRYYRDILRFAKHNNIPVIGLNLDRHIVSTVFRTGNTDTLTDSQRQQFPAERDLNLPGYSERLESVYTAHLDGNHGGGLSSGFIQAQAIWDETMAHHVVSHLTKHPGRKMVVLAGAQHTRKDSGIPPRVSRNLDVRQVSVLNVSGPSPPADIRSIADYFFLLGEFDLPEAGKLGILLSETETEEAKEVSIAEFTSASKAQTAGLQAGDIIMSLDGFPIERFEDLRIAMLDMQPGESVEVTVKRPSEPTVPITVKVELVGESQLMDNEDS